MCSHLQTLQQRYICSRKDKHIHTHMQNHTRHPDALTLSNIQNTQIHHLHNVQINPHSYMNTHTFSDTFPIQIHPNTLTCTNQIYSHAHTLTQIHSHSNSSHRYTYTLLHTLPRYTLSLILHPERTPHILLRYTHSLLPQLDRCTFSFSYTSFRYIHFHTHTQYRYSYTLSHTRPI